MEYVILVVVDQALGLLLVRRGKAVGVGFVVRELRVDKVVHLKKCQLRPNVSARENL